MGAGPDRECATCGRQFAGAHWNCPACRATERTCAGCGRQFSGTARHCPACLAIERTCRDPDGSSEAATCAVWPAVCPRAPARTAGGCSSMYPDAPGVLNAGLLSALASGAGGHSSVSSSAARRAGAPSGPARCAVGNISVPARYARHAGANRCRRRCRPPLSGGRTMPAAPASSPRRYRGRSCARYTRRLPDPGLVCIAANVSALWIMFGRSRVAGDEHRSNLVPCSSSCNFSKGPAAHRMGPGPGCLRRRAFAPRRHRTSPLERNRSVCQPRLSAQNPRPSTRAVRWTHTA